MKNSLTTVALLGLATLLVSLASQVSQGKDTKVGKDAQPQPHGAEIYRANCSACHGTQAAGTGLAPKISDVFTRLSEPEIREVLKTGRKVMPSMTHLEPAEINAVLKFLQAPSSKTKAPATTLAKPLASVGKHLFLSNCASCHATTPATNPKPGPASLVNVTRRFSATEIENIMRNGVCYMPSFNHFSAAEAQSVVAYLKTLESADAALLQGGCGSCDKVGKAARTAPKKASVKKGCDMDDKGCGMKAKKASAKQGCDMGDKACGNKAKKASAKKGCDMGDKACGTNAKRLY